MAGFFERFSGKARKKKIDDILNQDPNRVKPKPKKKRSGGSSADSITKMMDKIKADQDKRAGITRRK